MSTLSDSLTTTATTLLEKYGQTATFTRTSGGTYNPNTGSLMDEATSTYTANSVPTRYNRFQIDEQTVLATDIRLLVSNSGTEPLVGDSVSLSSTTYKVMNVNPIVLSASNIIYILQLRK